MPNPFLALYNSGVKVLKNMIKETTKKIHFYPANVAVAKKVVNENDVPTVGVSRKYNRLVFYSRAIREMGMEGKFVKLYYEPTKKIIGWQIRDKVEQHEMKIWKLCRSSKSNGVFSMGIGNILREMKGLQKQTYSSPVQKYREVGMTSGHHGEVFYFIELKDDVKLIIDNGIKSESPDTGDDSSEGDGGSDGEGTIGEAISE